MTTMRNNGMIKRKKFHPRTGSNELKHADNPLLGPCVSVKCLPSNHAIVPHRGGSILRSILKVQLLKSHVFGQIIVNLSQFRVSCYKFDVILKLRILPKALCKLQNDTMIYF